MIIDYRLLEGEGGEPINMLKKKVSRPIWGYPSISVERASPSLRQLFTPLLQGTIILLSLCRSQGHLKNTIFVPWCPYSNLPVIFILGIIIMQAVSTLLTVIILFFVPPVFFSLLRLAFLEFQWKKRGDGRSQRYGRDQRWRREERETTGYWPQRRRRRRDGRWERWRWWWRWVKCHRAD